MSKGFPQTRWGMAGVPATQDLERVVDSQTAMSAGLLFSLSWRPQEVPGPGVSPVGSGEGRDHMPLTQAVLTAASHLVPTAMSRAPQALPLLPCLLEINVLIQGGAGSRAWKREGVRNRADGCRTLTNPQCFQRENHQLVLGLSSSIFKMVGLA